MSRVQAQTKDLALLWRFAQPPLRYRRPKRILAIRERTPPSVWFGVRVQLPAEVSWRERITPRGFPGKPQMSDEPRLQIEIRRLLVSQQFPLHSTATSRLYRPCRSARSLHSR